MSSCKILYINVGVKGRVEGLLNRLACHWLVWKGLTAIWLDVIYYYVWSSHYFYQYAYDMYTLLASALQRRVKRSAVEKSNFQEFVWHVCSVTRQFLLQSHHFVLLLEKSNFDSMILTPWWTRFLAFLHENYFRFKTVDYGRITTLKKNQEKSGVHGVGGWLDFLFFENIIYIFLRDSLLNVFLFIVFFF